MSAAINADIIAPKNSAEIRVICGRTMVTPTDDRSVVTKAYVDALTASGTFSNGSFSLTWQSSIATDVYYVKPNPYTAIITLSSFSFTGNGSSMSAANTFPSVILPNSGSTSTTWSAVVPIIVTQVSDGAALDCVMAISRNTDNQVFLFPGHVGTCVFQNGAAFHVAQTCVVYSLYTP